MSVCTEDQSGPPDSKYCGDGGVYYLYAFDESDHFAGYVDYPLGAQLLPTFGLNLIVSSFPFII